MSDKQYGFRKNLSCELAVLELTQRTFLNMKHKKFTLGLFLDLTKVFDLIDHEILLSKLLWYIMVSVVFVMIGFITIFPIETNMYL